MMERVRVCNAVVLKPFISLCHGLDQFDGEHLVKLELHVSASAVFLGGKKPVSFHVLFLCRSHTAELRLRYEVVLLG